MKTIVFILLWIPAVIAGNNISSLKVTITGFENHDGRLGVALFNHAFGFPGDVSEAVGKVYAEVRDTVSVHFDSLAYGIYAVSVIHDANGNGKLDTNWLGIPLEGTGSSNNPGLFFGPPDFEDAAFKLDSDFLIKHVIIKNF